MFTANAFGAISKSINAPFLGKFTVQSSWQSFSCHCFDSYGRGESLGNLFESHYMYDSHFSVRTIMTTLLKPEILKVTAMNKVSNSFRAVCHILSSRYVKNLTLISQNNIIKWLYTLQKKQPDHTSHMMLPSKAGLESWKIMRLIWHRHESNFRNFSTPTLQ